MKKLEEMILSNDKFFKNGEELAEIASGNELDLLKKDYIKYFKSGKPLDVDADCFKDMIEMNLDDATRDEDIEIIANELDIEADNELRDYVIKLVSQKVFNYLENQSYERR